MTDKKVSLQPVWRNTRIKKEIIANTLIQTGASADTVIRDRIADIKQKLSIYLSSNILLFIGDIQLSMNKDIIFIVHNTTKNDTKVAIDKSIATLHLPWCINSGKDKLLYTSHVINQGKTNINLMMQAAEM